jgi:cell division protein FtsL
MQTEQPAHTHHKNRHTAERLEKLIGIVMVVAIALLAVGMIYGVMTTNSTPSYLR